MESLVPKDEKKLKKVSDFVIDYVQPKVNYADLLIENISKIETKLLVDGQVLVLPYSSKASMQLRLVEQDGRHVELSLGIESEDKMKNSIDTALAILQQEKPNNSYGLAPIPNPEKQRYGKDLKKDLREHDTSKLMNTLVDEITSMASEHSRNDIKINPEIWFFSQIEEKIIADTEGIYKTQVLPTTFLQVLVKAKKGNKQSQFRMRYADIEEPDMIIENQAIKPYVREKIEEAMDNSKKLLDARKLSKQEMESLTHYVLSPSTMVFVHEAQGHNFESDIIKEGGSGLFKRDGNPVVESIASDIIDIYDGPLLQDGNFLEGSGFGTQYIDDEGVEVQPVHLVQNGKIIGKLHNRETANFYNEQPNGRGFSELGNQRVVRMTNTYIAPSQNATPVALEELVKDIKLGVFLDGSMGGQVSKDGMATSLQIGYLIKDGKMTDTVLLPANMAVVTKSALLTAEGVSGKIQIPDGGFCGKAGQVKYVTDGGPIVKLKVSESVNLAY